MNLIIQLGPQAEELIAKLREFPKQMQNAIRRGMDRANALVVGQMTRTRFTGKGPFPVSEGRLGVRSGRLRRSLRWSRAVVGNDGLVSSSIGTNVEYMGAHEEGFSGEVDVRAHRRVNRFRDRFRGEKGRALKRNTAIKRGLLTKGGKLRAGTEQVASGVMTVRAHRRKMSIPARKPIQRGIEDGAATYAEQIGAALAAAWEKKGGLA